MTPAQLIDTASRHQVLLEHLKSGMVVDFNKLFGDVDKTVEGILTALKVERLDEVTRDRLAGLLTTLEQAQATIFDHGVDTLLGKMPEVATYEAAFEAKALKSVLTPEGRKGVKTPPAVKAADEAMKRPVQATGGLLEPLVRDWAKGAIAKTNGAIRMGYEQGQTVPQILKQLQGTQALNFKDGVTAVNKRQAATVVRTGVQHVAATAREVTYEENSDLVKGVVWVSTLDGKTTAVCRSLDGRKFPLNEGPRPPIHPNCRSTTAPDLDEAFDFLDKGATRSSKDGYVDANETYYSWLSKQDAAFQDATIGPQRGQLLREGGLSAERFASLQLDKNWHPITLEQMKELEPLAFQRAGLMEKFDPKITDTPRPTSEDLKANRANLPGRPGKGTSTGSVWDKADELEDKLGRKPTKQEVLNELPGVNPSTVGVQFGKWRKATGDATFGGTPAPVPVPVKEAQTVAVAVTKAAAAVPIPIVEKDDGGTIFKRITGELDKALAGGDLPMAESWRQQFAANDVGVRAHHEIVQKSVDTLRRLHVTYSDGNGGIDLVKLNSGWKDANDYAAAVFAFKNRTGVEFELLKHSGGSSATREGIHTLLEKAIPHTKTQLFKYPKDPAVPEAWQKKAQEAAKFMDRLAADRLKSTPTVQFKYEKSSKEHNGFYDKHAVGGPAMVQVESAPVSTFIHETGHHFETVSHDLAVKAGRRGTMEDLADAIEVRRKGEARKGMAGFEEAQVYDDEWAARGGKNYTSRIYKTQGPNVYETATGTVKKGGMVTYATEVTSTGVERLYSDPLEFYRKDPEHFEQTVRTLLDLW